MARRWATGVVSIVGLLGEVGQGMAQARTIQSSDGGQGMAPFVLPADGETRARATLCLAQAVYYEAGYEPLKGRQAVAQVVLNRLTREAFPKSVCGVVFEGSTRRTGCQFSFTCDGSLARRPEASHWEAAEQVAAAALAGYVAPEVGRSTHYHAAWMKPYWSESLIKTGRIGGHIFYRTPEGAARPAEGQYAGSEPDAPAGSAPVKAAAGISRFSVWGIQMATVTNHKGELVVHDGS